MCLIAMKTKTFDICPAFHNILWWLTAMCASEAEPLQEMSDSEVVNIGINHPAYKVRPNNDSETRFIPTFLFDD